MRKQLQTLALSLAPLVAVAVASPVAAQGPGPAPGAAPAPMPEVTLTSDSVARLLKTLPKVSELAAKHQSAAASSLAVGGAMPPVGEGDAKELQATLTQNGFTFEDFAMQASALMATFFALDAEALDKAIPSEKNPQIQAALADPNMPKEQKDALRAQLAFVKENRAKLVQQLTALASAKNKAVVTPLLPEVKKTFAAIEAKGKKAMESAVKGPRKQ